jgi:hypothetical protein
VGGLMARNGFPEDFDLIDIPGYPGMKMTRESAMQLAGACAEFWTVTGIRPVILEAGRTYATQVYYSKTLPAGTFARPGTSNHGWFIAVDMGGVMGSYDSLLWGIWNEIARRWGLDNVQGAATKSKTNPRGEAWHFVRNGTPQNRATGNEMAIVANLADQVNELLRNQTWQREQDDREDVQSNNIEDKINIIGATVQYLVLKAGWQGDANDRAERKLDALLAKTGVAVSEDPAPAKKKPEAAA